MISELQIPKGIKKKCAICFQLQWISYLSLVCSEVTLKLILVTTRLLTSIKKNTGNVKIDSSFKETLKCPKMLYDQSVKNVQIMLMAVTSLSNNLRAYLQVR